jgi:hypothetical protein
MRDFSIGISAEDKYDEQKACYGYIQIGDFREKLEINVSFWMPEDYIAQWNRAILRIVEKDEKSCLITSLSSPQDSNFIFWWPMYRNKDTVFIQNGILFLDEISSSFTFENPYEDVPDRETVSEDGEPISEWEISIDALKNYLTFVTSL